MSTESLGSKLRRLRLERKLPLRKVAAMLDMDVAILSKMERGQRKLPKETVERLAKIYGHDVQSLITLYLSEKVVDVIGEEENIGEILMAAESAISYKMNAVASGSFRNDATLSKENITGVFKKYFASQHKISHAWLFGSVARGDATAGSDIDIVIAVPIEKKFTLLDLAGTQEDLQHLIGRKVDVVTINGLKPEMKKRIEKEMILIYEA